MYYFLDQYPIREISSEMKKLQQQAWNKVGPRLRRNDFFQKEDVNAVECCLNGFISPFHHLSLDEEYDIYCYMAHEYHGSIGSVAAIKRGEHHTARCEGWIIPTIELPENGIDPMEVIYCDGTPEGYLEAALYEKLLQGFPRYANIYSDGDTILFERPESLDENWEMLFDVEDWRPRVKDSSLYFYMYKFEHGMEASNGRSRISLRCYQFFDDLDLLRIWGLPSEYPSHLSGRKRYHQGKHCCVFRKSRINIAEEPVKPMAAF